MALGKITSMAAGDVPTPPTEVALPRPLQRLLSLVAPAKRHPGLQLDKYSRGGDQAMQRQALQQVCQAAGDGTILADLMVRRRSALEALPAASFFRAETCCPLTLHLSRSSALENAGICLHPTYGFVYLPGSGLKGMTRAYAVTVAKAAAEDVVKVFGNLPGEPEADRQAAGAVVFHDAWPETWPKLFVDLVNNHHRAYYEQGAIPGDWEDPNLVSFLAVPPGVTFDFALSTRRKDEGAAIQMARTWLLEALCHLGAGAKTAAGYGFFRPVEEAVPVTRRRIWTGALSGVTQEVHEAEVQVGLVSPAFLGGADKQAQEKLRLSSLKGLLRSWWRVWHGRATAEQLRAEEALVFGSTDAGTGLGLLPSTVSGVMRLLRRGADMGSGGSPLGYLGFGPIGYDRNRRLNLTQVDALDAGQLLRFRLMHRSGKQLEQGLHSLWLLCALGGIGSRNRRGWGSLALEMSVPDLPRLDACQTLEEYRAALNRGMEKLVPTGLRRPAAELGWTAISQDTEVVLSPQTFPSWRHALEDLGRKFQAFRSWDRRGSPRDDPPGPDYENTRALLAESNPNRVSLPERAGFGLPYAQTYRSLDGARTDFTPIWVDLQGKETTGRRASPVICKVGRLADNSFFWQVAFLPTRFLPDGAQVRATNNRQRPLHRLAAPGPFGVARPNDPQHTLLLDFLAWLQGRQIAQTSPPTPSDPGPPVKPSGGKPAAPKPINQGQIRPGKLRRSGPRWIAVFPGDAREAVITNPAKLPADLTEERDAEFYIEQASKKTGVRTRFERLL